MRSFGTKGKAGKEGGAKAQKSGGGLICSMDMSGMDIPSRMLSGFCIAYSMPIAISPQMLLGVSLDWIINIYVPKLPTTNYTEEAVTP